MISAPPRHVALVVDGNRRWAREANMPFFDAYKVAGANLVDIVCTAAHLGVRQYHRLSLLSTENWKRDEREIHDVMTAFTEILYEHTPTFRENGVRVHTIGHTSGLPVEVQEALSYTACQTASCTASNFILAFNYGGRWDIVHAVKEVARSFNGEIDSLTEEMFAQFLSTAPYGDPDLLIRTGGQQRVSNFLMWQLAYSELYFSDLMWPDFSPEHFKYALSDFQQRERRKGA